MRRDNVNLSRHTVRKKDGKEYRYWYLRWFDAAGKQHGENIGRVDKVSKRQAEKLRRKKESELATNPGRRQVGRAPVLNEFLDQYYLDRECELASGTMELHRQTGRYLIAHFGGKRKIDAISRAEARGFKTALAQGELKRGHGESPI